MGIQAHVRKVNIIEYHATPAYFNRYYELAGLCLIDTDETPYEWYITEQTIEEALNITEDDAIRDILLDWLENCHDKQDGIFVDWF